MAMEHNTFCSCNGIWSICCDNPANYPEYLLCDDFQDSSLNIGEECSCGCIGDWSDSFILHDNPLCDIPEYLLCDDFQDSLLNIGEECSCGCIGDWSDSFILHDNPLKEPMCDILIRGTTRTRKIKESYLQECVRRYYNLN